MAHFKKAPKLSALLKNKKAMRRGEEEKYEEEIKELQNRMLRAQQGVYHRRDRVILAFEGFDAAGKGGAIRALTEKLDGRGFKVHPIGPPEGDEQAKHWLYRFWARLPAPGTIAVFDRTWYGRVLVERVDKLVEKEAWDRAYREIREFEQALTNDGIVLVKVFLGVSKEEQLNRFEDRLRDPYKRWKIGKADIHARSQWNKYLRAADDALKETHTSQAEWHLVPADHKPYARKEVLKAVLHALKAQEKWMEKEAKRFGAKDLKQAMNELGLEPAN
jgi:polyphosphate kinase 2 (PPK2 family)